MLEALETMLRLCNGLALAFLSVVFMMGIVIGIIVVIKTIQTLYDEWRVHHER